MASGLARFRQPFIRARRRMGGFDGWGRHLCSGPRTAAKQHFALTHPSNLRETRVLTVRSSPSRGKSGTRARLLGGAGLVPRVIPEERREDAGQVSVTTNFEGEPPPFCSQSAMGWLFSHHMLIGLTPNGRSRLPGG